MFTIMRHCIGTQNVDDLWFVLKKEKLPTIIKDIAPPPDTNGLPSNEEKHEISEADE